MKTRDLLIRAGLDPDTADFSEIAHVLDERDSALNRKKDEVAVAFAALMAFAGKTRSSLAESLGFRRSRVTAVLSGTENLTITSMYEIAEALGYDFDIVLRRPDAARAKQPWQEAVGQWQVGAPLRLVVNNSARLIVTTNASTAVRDDLSRTALDQAYG